MEELYEKIAKEILFIDTLETRNNRLDFPEVAVWCIKQALQMAYEKGVKDGRGS